MSLAKSTSKIQILRVIKLCAIFLLAGLMAYLCWPYCLKAPAPDESTFLYEGLLTAQGKIPYRDFFDFIWPGTFYLIALLIKLCGGLSMVVVRLFTLAVLLGCGALSLTIARKYLPFRWLCFLASLFWTLHYPASIQMQHHLMSGALGLLAVFFLWQTIGRTVLSRKHLIATGLSLSLCALFTQSLGIILILVLTGVVSIRLRAEGGTNLRAVGPAFLMSVAIPIVLTLLYLILNHALGDFTYASTIWLFQGGYVQTSTHWYFFDIYPSLLTFLQTPFPSIFDCLNFLLNVGYLLLPLLGIGGALLYSKPVFRNRNLQAKHWEWFLLGWASLGFLAGTLSHSSIFHMAYNGWVPFTLGCCVLGSFIARYPQLEISLLTLFFLLFYSLDMKQFKSAGILYSFPTVRSYGTLEKQLVWMQDLQNSANVDRMVKAIHAGSPEGENLFVYNLAPEFYILTDRYNPTRYQLLMSVLDTPKQIEEATEDLVKKRPKFILYEHQDDRFFLADPRFKQLKDVQYRLHPIERQINTRYKPFAKFSHYDLYVDQNATHSP
jgi:hypothetical protein